jgi:hypothetical protein
MPAEMEAVKLIFGRLCEELYIKGEQSREALAKLLMVKAGGDRSPEELMHIARTHLRQATQGASREPA